MTRGNPGHVRSFGTAAIFFAAVWVWGCSGPDLEPAVPPKTFAFEGKVDPKFVGDWTSSDKESKIVLDKDGGMKSETISHSVQGKRVVDVSGEWRAGGGNLMLRYADRSNALIVLKYSASLAGNTLTLQPAGVRLKTTYRRK